MKPGRNLPQWYVDTWNDGVKHPKPPCDMSPLVLWRADLWRVRRERRRARTRTQRRRDMVRRRAQDARR